MLRKNRATGMLTLNRKLSKRISLASSELLSRLGNRCALPDVESESLPSRLPLDYAGEPMT
jgi:hypothetical protein